MQAAKLMVALAAMAGSAAAGAQEPGDARKGLRFALEVCAGCHAVLPKQTASPNPRAPPFQNIANTPGMTGTALAVFFRTPHPTMPNLILEEDDRNDVIAFILSLREK